MAQALTASYAVSTDGGATFTEHATGLSIEEVARGIGRVRQNRNTTPSYPDDASYELVDPDTGTVWRWTAEELTPAS